MSKKKKKKLSEKQLAANRENAQKSTGPKDTSQTSQNATIHTLCGSLSSMIKGREEEFSVWREPMARSFHAVGPYETELVSELIKNMWGVKLSTTHLEWVMNNMGDPMDCEMDVLKRVGLVQRYKVGYERSVTRFRRELTRMQQLRLKAAGSRLPIDYSAERPLTQNDLEAFFKKVIQGRDAPGYPQQGALSPLEGIPGQKEREPLTPERKAELDRMVDEFNTQGAALTAQTVPVAPKASGTTWTFDPQKPWLIYLSQDGTIMTYQDQLAPKTQFCFQRDRLSPEKWEAAMEGKLHCPLYGVPYIEGQEGHEKRLPVQGINPAEAFGPEQVEQDATQRKRYGSY